jgi:hypothetical protein
MAADPDEGRTRETHSLVGDADAAIELTGHFPRRSKPVDINACRHYKGFPICQANVDPSRAAGIGFLLMTDCRTLQTR